MVHKENWANAIIYLFTYYFSSQFPRLGFSINPIQTGGGGGGEVRPPSGKIVITPTPKEL